VHIACDTNACRKKCTVHAGRLSYQILLPVDGNAHGNKFCGRNVFAKYVNVTSTGKCLFLPCLSCKVTPVGERNENLVTMDFLTAQLHAKSGCSFDCENSSCVRNSNLLKKCFQRRTSICARNTIRITLSFTMMLEAKGLMHHNKHTNNTRSSCLSLKLWESNLSNAKSLILMYPLNFGHSFPLNLLYDYSPRVQQTCLVLFSNSYRITKTLDVLTPILSKCQNET
jgi:hypothetical protein